MILRNLLAVTLSAFVVMNTIGMKQDALGLSTKDTVPPAPTTANAATEEIAAETKNLPSQIVYQFDRGLGAGRLIKSVHGSDGKEITTYVIARDSQGKIVSKRVSKVERTEPVNTVFLMGKMGYTTSRGSFVRSKVMTVQATAYTPSDGGGRAPYPTRMGVPARYGIIAVDPRKIPLGSLVFVEGYGMALAADTGSAIKGNRIDICVPSRSQAMNWGRRNVKIHVFGKESSRSGR